jgi:outer membrane protein OmpA-like peptidoglycan-associated protein
MLDLKTKRDRDDFFIAMIVIALCGWFLYHFVFCKETPVNLDPSAETSMVKEVEKDSDNDGVYDSEDDCPSVAGPIESNGCPTDADGDGVSDDKDLCPKLRGSLANKGCPPDSDGDGIYDSKDNCPDMKGTLENNGCPLDTDGDGVADNLDKCPNRKGTAANGGCPEIVIEKAEAAILERALKAVEFETASSKLKSSSQRILNDIASIMGKYPAYKVDIHGHTDSDGDDDQNKTLSQKRAESCKIYLESRGVASFRMKAKGHGEAKPIASNDNPEGKKTNRRVEFKLHY